MSDHLIKYEAACKAVAEAHRVDEAKDIRDKHIAIVEYARQSKNFELEKQALEIRLRAERKGGELLIEMKPIRNSGHGTDTSPPRKPQILPDLSEKPKQPEIISEKAEFSGGTPVNPKPNQPISVKPKLADLGVDKKLSFQMQKLAKMPEATFEAHIGVQKDKIDSKNERQLREEAKETSRAERQARRIEKETIRQEKEDFRKRVDESDLDPLLKEELKNEKLSKHIVPFAIEFAHHLEKDKEKLDEIMYNSANLNIYSRHKLANVLRSLGEHFSECADKLRNDEHTPDFDNMKSIN